MRTRTEPTLLANLNQSWARPSQPRPIVLLGAGGVVNDAHLPAYVKAKFEVEGIYDINESRSRATAERFGIAKVYGSLQEALSAKDAVFDVAVPPENLYDVISAMPERAVVLMQKPMGKDLEDARRIRQACRERSLCAGVNFQLRFSPMMLALRDAIARGLLGALTEVEVHLNLRTPWEVFGFLKRQERVEIQAHSLHYLDWIRSVLGEPLGVYARTVAHPNFPELRSTRTSAILDYGDMVRCCLSINHNFAYGPKHQDATIKVEGLRGAAFAKLGLLLNYPEGEADELDIITEGSEWTNVALQGRWFPDAFIGTMSSLQRFAAGEDAELPTSVEDAFKTMAVVEACYISDAGGGTPVPE